MTLVIRPTPDQVEDAWWRLMQGELGVINDPHVRAQVETLVNMIQEDARLGHVICDAEGEPQEFLDPVATANRVCRAYAELFYGGDTHG